MRLAATTWTDVAETETNLAAIPVGSTEQHGPHAPLGTDALAAEHIANAGADTYEGDVVVAPPIPIGISEEHRQFPGTLWVSEDTFREYVFETAKSLIEQGFDRIVLVNGHGGNSNALREVAGDITRHTTGYAVPFTWFEAVDVDMGHGGPAETALMRHIVPDEVHEDRIEEAKEGASAGWGEWLHGVNLAYDSAEFTDNGVVGDPGATDADDGAAIATAAAEALADVFEAIKTRDSTPPAERSNR